MRRFFTHAIAAGATLAGGVRLTMAGRVKVGAWLPFTAEQTVDADGAGSTEDRLLTIVARFDLPPEHPEVHVRIDERGPTGP